MAETNQDLGADPVVPASGAGPIGIPVNQTAGVTGLPLVSPLVERITTGSVGEAFRRLRANVMLAGEGEPPQNVLVTSATAGEGKTLTSIGLAAASASAGDRTILIECDLARPMVRRYLGVPMPAYTVVDAIGEPEGRIEHVTIGGLDVLMAPEPLNEPRRLSIEGLVTLLHRFRSVYDFVVIDVPPLTLVAETILVARISDGVLVVMDAEQAVKPAHRRLQRELEKANIKPLGLVLNRSDSVDPLKPYYGYYQSH